MIYRYEAFKKLKEFKNEMEKQHGRSIKTLRLDSGVEYLSQEFLDYLGDNGILSKQTPPYKSKHNGVVERRNRTLLDIYDGPGGSTQILLGLCT